MNGTAGLYIVFVGKLSQRDPKHLTCIPALLKTSQWGYPHHPAQRDREQWACLHNMLHSIIRYKRRLSVWMGLCIPKRASADSDYFVESLASQVQ